MGEGLATPGALVRLNAGVFARVPVHVATRLEALLALAALVRTFRTVRLLMDLASEKRRALHYTLYRASLCAAVFSPSLHF